MAENVLHLSFADHANTFDAVERVPKCVRSIESAGPTIDGLKPLLPAIKPCVTAAPGMLNGAKSFGVTDGP